MTRRYYYYYYCCSDGAGVSLIPLQLLLLRRSAGLARALHGSRDVGSLTFSERTGVSQMQLDHQAQGGVSSDGQFFVCACEFCKRIVFVLMGTHSK